MSDPTPQQLISFIREWFDLSELMDLCIQLGVHYDDIKGDTRSDKARELVLRMDRQGPKEQLELREEVRRARPAAYAEAFPAPEVEGSESSIVPPDGPPHPGFERKGIPIWTIVLVLLLILFAMIYFDWSRTQSSEESTAHELGTVTRTINPTVETTQSVTAAPVPSATPQVTEPPIVFFGIRTVLLPGGTKVEQVFAPGGSFKMGSSRGDGDEKPLHEVAVNSFWLDRTEVTNRQFAAFIQASGYTTTAEIEGSGRIYAGGSFRSMFGSD